MPERRNLADIIMAKIEEKEAMAAAAAAGHQHGDDMGEEEEVGMDLPPKVVQVSIVAQRWQVCISYT